MFIHRVTPGPTLLAAPAPRQVICGHAKSSTQPSVCHTLCPALNKVNVNKRTGPVFGRSPRHIFYETQCLSHSSPCQNKKNKMSVNKRTGPVFGRRPRHIILRNSMFSHFAQPLTNERKQQNRPRIWPEATPHLL